MDVSTDVSDEDLATCVRVLRALATADGGVCAEFREPRCKPLRQAMHGFLEDLRGSLFYGQKPDKIARRKEKKRQQNARDQQERALDRQAADMTRMRAERLRMLGQLEESAAAAAGEDGDAPLLTFVPDGAVGDDEVAPPATRLLLASRSGADADADASGVGPERSPRHDGEGEGEGEDEDEGEDGGPGSELLARGDGLPPSELRTLHSCYTCKTRFRTLHPFYAQLCPSCAALNYAKRQQAADLRGRTFLLTGARVKIGFHVALKLLRCGARVLATSRFPADAASRFASQPDAEQWLGRLQCYGLDLRDLSSLEAFCAHLLRTPNMRLDGVINNACQTIRRPAAYYAHLLPLELQPDEWSPAVRALLADHGKCFAAKELPPPSAPPPPPQPPRLTAAGAGAAGAVCDAEAGGAVDDAAAQAAGAEVPTCEVVPTAQGALAAAVSAVPSALWSQAPLWSAEEGVAQPDDGSAANFPVGVRDVNGQQLDTRTSNSWLLKLQDVSTPEAAEVLAINALAPFVINSRLRCLLEACPDTPRFVVNVSAMEGKFCAFGAASQHARPCTCQHPCHHTVTPLLG